MGETMKLELIHKLAGVFYKLSQPAAGEVKSFGPTVNIMGKNYVLNDNDSYRHKNKTTITDELGEREVGIEISPVWTDPPGHVPFPWDCLWVYDKDNQILALWRLSDGFNPLREPALPYITKLMELKNKGQLNTVNAQEFLQIENYMNKIKEKYMLDIAQNKPEKNPGLLDITEYYPEHELEMQENPEGEWEVK